MPDALTVKPRYPLVPISGNVTVSSAGTVIVLSFVSVGLPDPSTSNWIVALAAPVFLKDNAEAPEENVTPLVVSLLDTAKAACDDMVSIF